MDSLQQALKRAPHSLWADAAAMESARMVGSSRPWGAAVAYAAVAEQYPRSPLAPEALLAIVQLTPVIHGAPPNVVTYDEAKAKSPVPDYVQIEAAERLVRDYPRFAGMSSVANFLLENYPKRVDDELMMDAATNAAISGTPSQNPRWLLVLSGVQYRLGPAYAADAARNARAAYESAGHWLHRQDTGFTDRRKEGPAAVYREIQQQADQLLATSGEAPPSDQQR